jgi:hypothetical protein
MYYFFQDDWHFNSFRISVISGNLPVSVTAPESLEVQNGWYVAPSIHMFCTSIGMDGTVDWDLIMHLSLHSFCRWLVCISSEHASFGVARSLTW